MPSIDELQRAVAIAENEQKKLLAGLSPAALSDDKKSRYWKLTNEIGKNAFKIYELLKNNHPQEALHYFYLAYEINYYQPRNVLHNALMQLRTGTNYPSKVNRPVPDETPDRLFIMAIASILRIGEIHEMRFVRLCLQKAADRGHAKAQNLLGYFYQFGIDVKADIKLAQQYYTKSQAQGYADAQFRMGLLLTYNKSVKQDPGLAKKYQKKAAAQGHAQAQNELGHGYLVAPDTKKNPVRAVGYFGRAAAQGHPLAQYNLAYCYHNGEGVKQNMARAAKWYWLAAMQDQQESREILESCENTYFLLLGNLLNKKYEQCGVLLAAHSNLHLLFIEHILQKLIEMTLEGYNTRLPQKYTIAELLKCLTDHSVDLKQLFEPALVKTTVSYDANAFIVKAMLKLYRIQQESSDEQYKFIAELFSEIYPKVHYLNVPKECITDLLFLFCHLLVQNGNKDDLMGILNSLCFMAQQFVNKGEVSVNDLPLRLIATVLIKNRFPEHALVIERPVELNDIFMILACCGKKNLTINELHGFLGDGAIVPIVYKRKSLAGFFETTTDAQGASLHVGVATASASH